MKHPSPHLPLQFDIIQDGSRGTVMRWRNAPGEDALFDAEELREVALGLLDAAADLSDPERGRSGNGH